MSLFTRSALVALALVCLGPLAHAADQPDPQELQRQIRKLEESVRALQQKLGGKESAEKAVPGEGNAEATAPVTRDDLNGLRTDLENFKYQYSREREYNTAQSNRPVNITGLVQARAGYSNIAPVAAPTTANGTKLSFNGGNTAVQFSGNLYRDYEEGRNLSYVLRAGANATLPGGGAGANASGNLYVQFANLTYNFLSTLNPEGPLLSLTFGQQLLPFGLEVAAPDELKPTIIPAQFTSALFPNQIDIGLVLRGDLWVQYDYGYSYRAPLLTYIAGVVNGSGPNMTDNNNQKDYFGRVVFTAPAEYNSWLRQLAIGASVYKGTQNTTVNSNGTAVLSGTGIKERLGFDVYYNHHPFGVTYEFVRGRDGRTFGTSVVAKQLETVVSQSHVATVYYTFGSQFLYAQSVLGTASVSSGRFDDWWPKSYQPFARVDLFIPSLGTRNAAYGFPEEIYTGGFNVFFAQTTKFQVNYNWIRNHNSSAPLTTHQILGQFQFGF